ncbi:MAG: hypothetical protein IPL45_00150 [Actinomycetales bacterium]|nr:hypothetical protein [Actinomycetales bacterium]
MAGLPVAIGYGEITNAVPYWRTRGIIIDPGGDVDGAGGAVVKAINSSSTLTVLGTLVAQGTAAAPAVFTSIADDSAGGDTNGDGDASAAFSWGGVMFWADPYRAPEPTGTLVFDHVDFRKGSIGGGTAESVSMTNSVFTDAFSNSITARGDIEFRSNTVSGSIPHAYSSSNTGSVSLSAGGAVNITDNRVTGSGGLAGFGAAGTTITGNTITGTLPWSGGISSWNSSVSPTDGPVTVMNNTVTGSAGDAVQVHAYHLRPSQLTGNTGSTNSRNVMVLSGRLEQDLTLPVAGLPVAIGYGEITNAVPYWRTRGIIIDPGVTLTVQAGAVVKAIDSSSTLTVLGTLVAQGTAAAPAVFTSIADDSAGGDTNGDGTASSSTPAHRWGGIRVTGTDPVVPVVDLAGVDVRWAVTAVAASGATSVRIRGRLAGNVLGVSAVGSAVDARMVDWGDSQGPYRADGSRLADGAVIVSPWYGLVLPPLPTLEIPPHVADRLCPDFIFIGVRGLGRGAARDGRLHEHQ